MRKYFALLFLPLLFLGVGCGSTPVVVRPVVLEYWRAEDAPNALAPVIAAYKKIHPNVTIHVTEFREEEMETKLLEAFAEDRGPDMISLPNVALPAWTTQILPLPAELSVPTPGTDAKGQPTSQIKKTKAPTKIQIEQAFVEAANTDLTITDPKNPAVPIIMGVPFSLDTLALYSNNSLLSRAKISRPPGTWQDFQTQVEQLTSRTTDGTIVQSGAAIGTARNVRYSTELLSALMMQNGAEMISDNGSASFHRTPSGSRDIFPSLEALNFYRGFSVPGASQYAWDTNLPDSLDAFVSGKAAFYFGLPADARKIRERNPRLTFTISPLPQVDPGSPVPIARFPVEMVTKKTTQPNEAWDFLLFAASADNVTAYLTATSRPPALRSLLGNAVADPAVGAFAGQVLTAKSWYRGTDYSKVNDAFQYMIETPITVEAELSTLLNTAASLVNETL